MSSPRPATSSILLLFFLATYAIVSTGCATAPRKSQTDSRVTERVQVGNASYYAKKFHGKRTASGERYDMHQLTAAHRSLRFGATVKVTHVENGRSVVVRINDRGPFARQRIIDVSLAAARQLGMLKTGVAPVKLEVLSPTARDPGLVTAEK